MHSSAAKRWVCASTCLLLFPPLHAGVGLWFVRSPEPLIAPPGDEVVFDCSLNVPADQVRWRHGARFLDSSFAAGHGSRSNRLVVRANDASDTGEYQCVAWFGAAALTSVPAGLTLAELRPFPGGEDRVYQASPGNTVALRCDAPLSRPPAILQFLKDGRKLPVRPSARTGALVLSNVTLEDSGRYGCLATNYLTGQTERLPYSLVLSVGHQGREPPRFLSPPPSEYTVQAGGCCPRPDGAAALLPGAARGPPGEGAAPLPVPSPQRLHRAGRWVLLPARRSGCSTPWCCTWATRGGSRPASCPLLPASTPCRQVGAAPGQTERLPYSLVLRVGDQGREPPRFLPPPPSEYTVQAGWNVTLECSGVGEPVPSVSWSRLGAGLPAERLRLVAEGLALREVRRSDEGTYLCRLGNGVGAELTHRATLHVQEAPVVTREPGNAEVEEGGEVTLACEARGSPAPRLSWVLNGESLDNDSHARVSGGRLRLERIEKRHAGIVQCFASNELGSAYGSATLQVVPKQVTSQPGAGPFPADPDVEAAAPLPPAVSGAKGSGRHDAGHKGKGRRKHKGNAVMIPPSRPNITRLTDSSVMVHWSVPPNSGLPIQFFKVQHREMPRHRGGARAKGKSSRWKTSNEDIAPHVCSYEVDGLEPDRTYRFRIAAVYSNNDNKLGPNSARFHLHRGSHLESTPRLVRTEAVGATAIRIFWEFLAASGRVDGFYVYYRATSSAGQYVKATVEGQGARSFNITHLAPDTAYDIKIQSFTIGGASDFSAILTNKTLGSPTERPQVVMVGAAGSPQPSAPGGRLFLVVGAVSGGLLLLGALLLLAVLLRRRRAARDRRSPERDGQHDKLGESPSAITPPNAYATNLLNGSLPLNGYQQGNKMNITTNPLADADQNKIQNAVEMSFLSSRNNNCSSASEASSGVDADGGPSEDEGAAAQENYV
ncbi:interference hedgehog-like isoform X1 [Bacillus rossius redtenbacheri]|uniref:interference hedgehog-like isoform X1 n=1 Tax=Bacillus rossius redtenbacheri TaxID=93214 RepID=UPI002FDECC98